MHKQIAYILFTIGLIVGCGSSGTSPIAAVVEGDSMAPTICGQHLGATCIECGCEFAAAIPGQADRMLTCPNCGYEKVAVDEAKRVPPAEVQLESFARFPRRWEMVGFELPEDSGEGTAIKRIVGLPGDTVEIRDGDLFVNDNILRKSWALQKELRIPVFDSKHDAISPFDNTHRFQSRSPDSGWEVRGSQLRFASIGAAPDWLDYIQWRNCRRDGQRDKPFPIEDYYGFNQELARKLNSVRDVMVQLDVEFEVDSTLAFQCSHEGVDFEFSVTKKETEFLLSWSGESDRKPLVFQSRLEDDLPRGVIEFSCFDQTLMLRINGNPMFELRSKAIDDPAQAAAADAAAIFTVGGLAGSFRIERFQLWRDIHYLGAPAGFQAEKNVKLTAGKNEYLLLGDNSPVSLDSRTWKNPGISRNKLIGRLRMPSTGK